MEGKTIKRVWIEKEPKEDEREFDDEPYLFLEMTDGTLFKITSSYGGYTGGSKDEYPAFISIEEVKE
jgi:hypothetical protein